MAQDLERWLVRIDASTEGLRRELKRADQLMGGSEKSLTRSTERIANSFERVNRVAMQTRNIIGSVIAARGVNEVVRYADTWKQLEGRLSIVTKNSQEFNSVQSRLFQLAQDNRTGLPGVTNLYVRLSQAIGDNANMQTKLLPVVDAFAKGLAITGESAAAAQGAIVQFSQAIAGDFKASAQELNSIIEQAPRVAKAIADGLGAEAGELKKLAKEGELSTERVVNALVSQAQVLEAEFAKMPRTVGQALQEVDNAFLKYIGQNNAVSQGVSSLALGLHALAHNFENVADAAVFLGSIVAGRLAASLGVSAIAFAKNTQQALLYQSALARMAGVSVTAATAAGILSKSLALFGGPVGAAVTGLAVGMFLLSQRTSEYEQAQQESNNTLIYADELHQKLTGSVKDQRKELEKDRDALLDNAQAALENAQAIAQAAAARARFVTNVGQESGGGILSGTKFTGSDIEESQRRAGEAIQVVTERLKTLNALREKFAKTSQADTKEEIALTEEQKKAIEEAEKNIESMRDALENLQRSANRDVLRQKMDEYQQVVFDTRNEVQDLAEQYDQELTPAIERQIKAVIKARQEALRYQKAEEKRQETQTKIEQRQRELADLLIEPYKTAMRNIQNLTTDTFEGIANGSVDSFSDAADRIKQIFIRMAAELATLQLFNSGVGGFTPGALAGGAASGLSNLSSFPGMGSAIGSTAIGSAINGFGASVAPSLFSMGAPLAGAVGPTQMGSLAALGLTPATLGLAAAAVILPKIFDALGSSPNPASTFSASITDSGNLGSYGALSKHMDSSLADMLAERVTAITRSLSDAGVDLTGTAISGGYDVNRGSFFDVGGKSISFDNDDSDSVNRALVDLTQTLVAIAGKSVPDLEKALKSLDTAGRSAEEVLNDIAAAAEMPKLRQNFMESLDYQLMQMVNPVEARLMQIRREFDALEQQAMGLNADTSLVRVMREISLAQESATESLNEATSKARDLSTRFAQISTRYDSLLFDLRFGQYSPLSPSERLSELRRQVTTTGTQARLGNADAAEELAQLLPEFVELSGEVNGFNQNFERDRAMAEDLAEKTKSVADRQLQVQQQIFAELQEQSGLLYGLNNGRSVGSVAADTNAHSVLASGISSGSLSSEAAQAIARSVGFSGQFGGGAAQAFYASNPAANAAAIELARRAGVTGFAAGGMVRGGVPGRDSVPAMLTPGEFVIRAPSVQSIGAGNLERMNMSGQAANDALKAEVATLRGAVEQLTRVVAMSGQMSVNELQKLNNTNKDIASFQTAAAFKSRK